MRPAPPTTWKRRGQGQISGGVKFNLGKTNFHSSRALEKCTAAEEGIARAPSDAWRARVKGLLTNVPKWLIILCGAADGRGICYSYGPRGASTSLCAKVHVCTRISECLCARHCASRAPSTLLRMPLILAAAAAAAADRTPHI